MDQAEEARLIEHLIERLCQQYPALPADTVRHTVGEAHSRFSEAPIRDFVPLFVERQSKAKLAGTEPALSH